MEERTDKIPRWFATRWAGVAVIALRYGASFERLWVRADGGLRGAIEGFQWDTPKIPAAPDLSSDLAAAIVAYAGPMAEARARGTRVDEVARRDPDAMAPCEDALALLEKAGIPDARARVSALCRDLFNAPKVWTAVNAVAGSLQARKVLMYYDVILIVDNLER